METAKQAAALEINATAMRAKILARIRVERWAANTSNLLSQAGGAPLADVEAALAAAADIEGAAASLPYTQATAAVAALRGVQERGTTVLASISAANERSAAQVCSEAASLP